MDDKPTPTFEQRTAQEFRQDVVMLLVILVIVCTGIFLFADLLKWVIVHIG